MLEARNCNISINNTGLMAQGVTLNSANSVVPVRSVGKKGFSKYTPNGPITHTLSINYVLKTEREPNYQIYNTIRSLSDSSSYSPVNIKMGGISGEFYLNSYSVSSSPNNLSTAQANYISFQETLDGYLNDTLDTGIEYVGTYTGFANGWTTFFYENGVESQDPVYDFNYSFQAEWEPSYVIGSKTPFQTDLMSYTENLSLVREIYTKPKFSGEDIYMSQNESGDFDGTYRDSNLRIYGLYRLCDGSGDYLSFALSGANITSSNVDFRLNDLILTETTATRIG